MRTVKTLLSVLLLGTFFLCLGANIYTDLNYEASMPASPRPAEGRIYRIEVNHGFARYVTQQELERAKFYRTKGMFLGFLCIFGAVFMVRDRSDFISRRQTTGMRERPVDSKRLLLALLLAFLVLALTSFMQRFPRN